MNNMDRCYEIYLIVLSGYFILSGTYILSKNIFDSNIKKLINFAHNQSKLPFCIKLVIFIFGYRNALKDINFWNVEYCPTTDSFSYHQKIKIIEPFIGFIFIATGTLISLLI